MLLRDEAQPLQYHQCTTSRAAPLAEMAGSQVTIQGSRQMTGQQKPQGTVWQLYLERTIVRTHIRVQLSEHLPKARQRKWTVVGKVLWWVCSSVVAWTNCSTTATHRSIWSRKSLSNFKRSQQRVVAPWYHPCVINNCQAVQIPREVKKKTHSSLPKQIQLRLECSQVLAWWCQDDLNRLITIWNLN